MKKRNLYILWGVLYCLCVGLSFTTAEGLGKTMLSALGIAFFGPPFYLLWQARKEEDRKTELVLRLISAIVLVLALLLLILNFLSVNFTAEAGLALYVLLVMFVPPMGCIQAWILCLFLWACLLMLTLQKQNHDQT